MHDISAICMFIYAFMLLYTYIYIYVCRFFFGLHLVLPYIILES